MLFLRRQKRKTKRTVNLLSLNLAAAASHVERSEQRVGLTLELRSNRRERGRVCRAGDESGPRGRLGPWR